MTDYEAWRPALIAFWKIDCCFQHAENLVRGGAMDELDRRTIEALAAAAEFAPMRAAA